MIVVGAVIGAVATYGALASSRQRGVNTRELPQCRVSLVLVGSDGSRVSEAIDRRTGGGGWTHAYLDPCRLYDDGERAILDFTARRGLHWSRSRTYAGRTMAAVILGEQVGTEVSACMRARVGMPFSVPDLIAGTDSERTCTGLIASCFPRELRDAIPRANGKCIAPNDLARYFGVAPARSDLELISQPQPPAESVIPPTFTGRIRSS